MGGYSIQFTDGSGTNWTAQDTGGQGMNSLTTSYLWVDRTVLLDDYKDRTISTTWVGVEGQTAPGDWQEYFADLAIVSTDGTVTPIYNRFQSAGLTYFGSGMTNLSGAVERAKTDGDAMQAQFNTTYYVSDHLNTAQMEFAARGWPVWQGDFAPYGQEIAPQATANNYKFTGQERDSETGLDHFQYRSLSSTMGRWTSPDPYNGSYDLSNPQSLNRYSYVQNNPLRWRDWLGLNQAGCTNGPVYDEDGTFLGDQQCVDVYGGGDGDGWSFDNFSWTYWSGGGSGVPSAAGEMYGGAAETATNNKTCMSGPMNLTQNMQLSKSLAKQFWSGIVNATPGGATAAAAAAGAYFNLVHTGGPWDPKTTLGMTPSNIAAGNINFGATCSQFGGNTWIGGQVCQYGAGIYGRLSGDYGSSFFSRSHGDIPSDNQQIRQGLAIARKGKC